ncbi:MAG: N-acetyltransferase [Rhodospirillaceae bacterium]|nr:N-acetyltransferase [Rhodospirillaceae bacterium]
MPDGREHITVKALSSLSDVTAAAWDSCAGNDNPFVSHAFLSALEDSGSATAETGWMAQHLVIEDGAGGLLAVAPLYLKTHSYGEYVFDWGWADAYERAGGHYYPKLQCSVPFTPATGPRLLVRADAAETQGHDLRRTLCAAMVQLADKLEVSSLHITFPEQPEWEMMGEMGFLQRVGQQFHWQNQGYESFDDFLGALASRKRKQLRKERQKVSDTGLTFRALRGADITEAHWQAFYRFYRNTVDKKWGSNYLTRTFFPLLSERLGDAVVLIVAEDGGRVVAGALNLVGGDTIYGRNWGCDGHYKFLHFETCYYQAIEFAIQHGLKWVEAGAQGTHKIQRGYLPTPTYSAHWIADDAFRNAVARFLGEEKQALAHEMAALAGHSPYRNAED